MGKLKKFLSKFWPIIVSVFGGAIALIFLGNRKPKETQDIEIETISNLENKKEEAVADIKKMEERQEVIKSEVQDVTTKTKKDIDITLSKDTTNEETISDFIDSW